MEHPPASLAAAASLASMRSAEGTNKSADVSSMLIGPYKWTGSKLKNRVTVRETTHPETVASQRLGK